MSGVLPTPPTVVNPDDLTQGIQASAPSITPTQVVDIARQYGRKLSIVVSQANGSGIDFAEFKVTFEVRRGDSQTPNSADVRIYNLSNDTASKICQPEFSRLTIQAGYPGNYGVIFIGDIKQTRRGRIDQKDTYVDITAADGDSAYNFSVTALQFAATVAPLDQIKGVIQTMARWGVDQGYMPDIAASKSVRGTVYYGSTRDILRQIANNNDCVWSIQNGKVVFIPLTAPIAGGSIPLISSTSGLIGVPELTENGVSVKVLLNPSIKIGQVIKLQSGVNTFRLGLDLASVATNPRILKTAKLNGDGLYYVMQADHTGDTRGTPWYTDLTCLAVDASVSLAVAQRAAIDPAASSIPRY